jgi:putative membrane protein insertion efficiency factor
MKLDDLFDASRHASHAPRLAGRGLIRAYRYTLSPLVGFRCRHLPTCSDYADQALDRFGLWAGGWMTLARLLRCQPWGTSGLDFVPQALPEKSRWYMPWRYSRWQGTNDFPPVALAGPDAASRRSKN